MYDIAIIGAGVIGSAIARELSRYQVNTCVIEREEDVCCGTSKANSAIIHAGFDATPGTLKARLNVRGNELMEQLSKELDIPFKRNGSLVVCTKNQDRSGLTTLLEKGEKNGVPGLRILEREELIALEPNLSDDVTCALFAPTGGIVCPFHMTMAFAENAFTNGVTFFLNTNVTKLSKDSDKFTIETIRTDIGKPETIEAKVVINAAGVYSDTFNNMVSEHKLHITARKGEYCLLDKDAGNHVSHTIFQLPSKMGKGVLVSPTVHGNLLVGPTAVDVMDKEAVNTTQEGLDSLAGTASLSVKNVPMRQVITSFAGLRAHEDGGDFVIGEAEDVKGFINAAGIESPGLSSAPAIGEMVAEMVHDMLSLKEKTDFIATRKGILHPETLSLEERNQLIKEQPAYGNIICRCEMITEGEILDAIHRPLGARSLDGVKRRTRAGMGRCQAGFCSPRTMEILEREVPMSIYDITKNGGNGAIVIGRNKEI
ncbi:MAG: NAD(P)/FAD-dependent oxidoreductase [Clostridiales bacterium]|nr:NAD(P)/FAD-dependent oxidoreductase [Clostridiales bacterium]